MESKEVKPIHLHFLRKSICCTLYDAVFTQVTNQDDHTANLALQERVSLESEILQNVSRFLREVPLSPPLTITDEWL